jgi:tetratricopeptide (TPR) repeat protein
MSTLRMAFTWLGLLALCTGVAAETTPSRGDLFQEWRLRLDSADRAIERGEDEAAIRHYDSILNDAEQRGEDGLLVARATDGLADLHRMRHRYDLAAPLYERSAARWARLLGANQPRRAVTLHNLGICYVELADWPAAERALREALTLWQLAGVPETRSRETQKVLDAALARRSIPWGDVSR